MTTAESTTPTPAPINTSTPHPQTQSTPTGPPPPPSPATPDRRFELQKAITEKEREITLLKGQLADIDGSPGSNEATGAERGGAVTKPVAFGGKRDTNKKPSPPPPPPPVAMKDDGAPQKGSYGPTYSITCCSCR